ncbi:MAG: metal-dependent transcriptional regulator [Nitrososphaerota archaeon]
MPNITESRYLMMLMRNIEIGTPIRTSLLSQKVGVKPPSVVEILNRLESHRFVRRVRWGETVLTRKGERIAKNLLHNHRVLEIYFVTFLGMSKEVACREASRIDLYIGQKTINAMCKTLNHPCKCFHGKEVYHENCI